MIPTGPELAHLAAYEDLAYAYAKGGEELELSPVQLGEEPGGDAMRWAPEEE